MRKTGIWLLHAGYWLLFLILLLTFFFFVAYVPAHVRGGTVQVTDIRTWTRLMTGFALVPALLTFYTSYHHLFDRFLSRQRFFLFFTWSIITAFISSAISAGLASMPVMFGAKFLFGGGVSSAVAILVFMTLVAWIHAVTGAVIKGAVSWYFDIRVKEELHRRNMETELALVKAQIDPHFLFNTLNNIDVMIGEDASLASSYLNKLSSLLRFLLYDTKADFIALEKELYCLEQYIALQRIRTANESYVTFERPDMCSGKIAPMLLLSFVENAFKYTAHAKATSQVNIIAQLRDERLLFTCTNTIAGRKESTVAGGLGNSLIRKRLQLLYPGRYRLTNEQQNNIYYVELELEL